MDASHRGCSRSHAPEAANDEALALPLAEQYRGQAPRDMSVGRVEEEGHGRPRTDRPEEVHPTEEVGVEPCDAAGNRLPKGSWRLLADSPGETLLRTHRRQHLNSVTPHLLAERNPTKWLSFGRATALLAWFTLRRMRPSMNWTTLAITRCPAPSLGT